MDSSFVAMFAVYFYIYSFLCVYNYLTACKISRWMKYCNPCTYVLATLLFPHFAFWSLFYFVWSTNRVKEPINEFDDLENIDEAKVVEMDILENEDEEDNENIISEYNAMIQLNYMPDKGPKAKHEDAKCSVCINILREGDILAKTKCCHVYHYQCLNDRIKAYKYCKECYFPINLEKE